MTTIFVWKLQSALISPKIVQKNWLVVSLCLKKGKKEKGKKKGVVRRGAWKEKTRKGILFDFCTGILGYPLPVGLLF